MTASAVGKAPIAMLVAIAIVAALGVGLGIAWVVSGPKMQPDRAAEFCWNEFATQLGISEENQHLTFGRPETEIDAIAAEIGADLIVVGSHGRHGIALILGSTANGVLHGAPCDVLAVRVGLQESS